MSDFALQNRLVNTIAELLELSGEHERSRFYQGVEVLQNSTTAAASRPPPGHILVRIEGIGQLARYYGREPSIGDPVGLLMLENQTPVVIQNFKTGLPEKGWPFDTNILTVDTDDPDADYDSVEDALDDAAGEQVLVSPETHSCGGKTLTGGSSLVGMDMMQTILSSAADDPIVTVNA
ncbi:hypothetical protein DRH14_03005, partial [Candidatus Shapirobacteria bacterium]